MMNKLYEVNKFRGTNKSVDAGHVLQEIVVNCLWDYIGIALCLSHLTLLLSFFLYAQSGNLGGLKAALTAGGNPNW